MQKNYLLPSQRVKLNGSSVSKTQNYSDSGSFFRSSVSEENSVSGITCIPPEKRREYEEGEGSGCIVTRVMWPSPQGRIQTSYQ